MSTYSSEYSMSSVNSVNENIYNAQKQAKSSKYRLRKIFKPILKMIMYKGKKSAKHVCKCKHASYSSYDYSSEISDNDSNETLETRILDEIRDCGKDSAVYDYGKETLMPMNDSKYYVPVHFARTHEGTFFWTTFDNKTDDCPESQLPQLHLNRYDRWIQA